MTLATLTIAGFQLIPILSFKRLGFVFKLIKFAVDKQVKLHVAIDVITKTKVFQEICEKGECQSSVSVLLGHVEEHDSAADCFKVSDGVLNKASRQKHLSVLG